MDHNRCFCNVCVRTNEPMINWESLIRGPISRSKFVVTILSCSIILVPPGAVFYGLGYISPYLYSYLVANSTTSHSIDVKDLVWLELALMFGQIAGVLAGGLLERRNSTQTITRAAVCIFNLNVFLMYFSCLNIYSLATSYLVGGFSLGLIYVMTLVVGLSWIEKHRHGLFSGLLSVGFGIAILIIGPLEALYLNPNSLEPRPSMLHAEAGPFYDYPAILNKVPMMFIVFGVLSSMIQFPLSYLLVKNPELANEQLDQDSINDMTSRPRFYLLFIIFGMNFVSMAYMGYYLKRFAETLPVGNSWTLELVIALSGVLDAVGRPTWGYVHDKFGVKIAMSLLCFTTSIFIFISYSSKFVISPAGCFVLFSFALWGVSFCTSGNHGVMPAATIQFFGEEDLGLKYGILYLSQGFGVVLIILYDTFIPQWMPFIMTIVFTSVVAGILSLVLRRNETLNDQARALLESSGDDSLVPINEFRLSRRGNSYEYKSVS